jgi:lipopolysaccharide/colanic/teichoic acid biosynthesis glycosyltransferase
MNTAANLFPDPRLVARFETFHTPWGRWRLRLYLRYKYLLWRQLVGGAHVAKRGLDLLASGSAMVLLSPLFLLIALLIKLEDGGPVIFSQIRVGRFGREFRMFKFRSMRPDAEARLKELLGKNHHLSGVTFKIKDDPRITGVGRWLRKFSFDEFPQLYNVLIGDMSLVGPRPPMPCEVALYSLADRRRLAVEPGITCLWQISGRAEIDFPGQVQLDVRYIESRNLWQDIKIIGRTIPAVLSGTGAY